MRPNQAAGDKEAVLERVAGGEAAARPLRGKRVMRLIKVYISEEMRLRKHSRYALAS